jgi:hypothetical protein
VAYSGASQHACCVLEHYRYGNPVGREDSSKKRYRLSQRARSAPSAVGTRVRHRYVVSERLL